MNERTFLPKLKRFMLNEHGTGLAVATYYGIKHASQVSGMWAGATNPTPQMLADFGYRLETTRVKKYLKNGE